MGQGKGPGFQHPVCGFYCLWLRGEEGESHVWHVRSIKQGTMRCHEHPTWSRGWRRPPTVEVTESQDLEDPLLWMRCHLIIQHLLLF